jgi:hypothetical protein
MRHGSAAEYMKLAQEDERAARILIAGGGSNRVAGSDPPAVPAPSRNTL